MEKNNWLKSSFSLNRIPDWICPSCNIGLLSVDKDQFHYEQTSLSIGWQGSEEWNPEDIQYRFHGALKCMKCLDLISFIGNGKLEIYHYFNNFTGEHEEEHTPLFTPFYFYPALNIFHISEKCPHQIKKEILDSFSLFFNDLPSCGNKIRTSLEILMNHQKIRRTYLQGRQKKDLHYITGSKNSR